MESNEIIKVGQILQYDGQDVEVIGVDSDPRAAVAVVLISNPDRCIFAQRSELG